MADVRVAGIFVSHGRQEGLAAARAIVRRLRDTFGASNVYSGSDELTFGEDLGAKLEERLNACRCMLVLIGPWWTASINAAKGEDRWLEHHDNLARHEISSALQRGLKVIPVTIDGTAMPRRKDLPADLQPLVDRNWFGLRLDRLDADMSSLLAVLSWGMPPKESAPAPVSASVRSTSRFGPLLGTALTHTRRRVAQVLHPLGGELLPAVTAWRAAFWLVLLALLLWGVVWPYLWPALMPAPAAAAATEAPLPAATGPVLPVGTRFRDCRDATCPWLRVLPAGTFTMGSPDDEPGREKDEGPQHQVTVTRPFAVMETEVTVGLFKAFVAETHYLVETDCEIWDGKEFKVDRNTSWRKPFAAVDQQDDHPVVCVSWNTAQAFARWMTKRTGQPYRLLSEAEWEYAARAGRQEAYSFGADAKQLCRFADVGDTRTRQGYPEWGKEWVSAECDDGHVYTAPVGSFQPNAFGLYDMHGNAWELVQDCQNDYQTSARTEVATESTTCSIRMARGGAWNSVPLDARSARRFIRELADRDYLTGFRLARMLP